MNPQELSPVLKLNFKVYKSGDQCTLRDHFGHSVQRLVLPKEIIITLGDTASITLTDMGDYFAIGGVGVDENLRKRGIGTQLYEEALKLAKAEGKKGIVSYCGSRNNDSDRRWRQFKRERGTSIVTIDDLEFDFLPVPQ